MKTDQQYENKLPERVAVHKKRHLVNCFSKPHKKHKSLLDSYDGGTVRAAKGRTSILELRKPKRSAEFKSWMGKPIPSESKFANAYMIAWRNILSANSMKVSCREEATRFFRQAGETSIYGELLDIAQVISFATQSSAPVTFIRGSRWEETLIYGALDLFLGIIIAKKSGAYVLLRNPENISEWVKRDPMLTSPDLLTIRELKEECSNGVFYVLNNSGVIYNQNDDFKTHCLKMYLANSHPPIETYEEINIRKIAIELYLPLAIQNTHLFQDLSNTKNWNGLVQECDLNLFRQQYRFFDQGFSGGGMTANMINALEVPCVHPDVVQTLLSIMAEGLRDIYLLPYNSVIAGRKSIVDGHIMGVIGKEKHFAILAVKVCQGVIRSFIVASSSLAYLLYLICDP